MRFLRSFELRIWFEAVWYGFLHRNEADLFQSLVLRIADDTEEHVADGSHFSICFMLDAWCLHFVVKAGCVLLAMSLSDKLSSRNHVMRVIPCPIRHPFEALLIVLLTTWSVFASSYASTITDGLVRWLGIERKLCRFFAPGFAQVVCNYRVRWHEWSGIVHVILK